MRCIKSILQIIFLLNVCLATLSPPSDKKGQKGVKPQEGPRKNNVLDRKLVNEAPLVKDILKYHATYHQDVITRNFKNAVLGYVTPVSISQKFSDCIPIFPLYCAVVTNIIFTEFIKENIH